MIRPGGLDDQTVNGLATQPIVGVEKEPQEHGFRRDVHSFRSQDSLGHLPNVGFRRQVSFQIQDMWVTRRPTP